MSRKTGALLVMACAGLMAGLAFARTGAYAGDLGGSAIVGAHPVLAGGGVHRPIVDRIVPHGVAGDRIRSQGFFVLPSGHRSGRGRPGPGRLRRRHGASTVVLAPPAVVGVVPPEAAGFPGDDYDAEAYGPPDDLAASYSPPVVYTQPVDMAMPVAPPAPAPTPTVVQYDLGRYELRGDGIATPYTWVWIPNPPPPPPPGPPAAMSPPGPPPLDDSRVRHGQLYRWTDEQGVMHLTDRLESVPRQYRAQANESPPS
jgi:hypothetical protein